MMYSLLGNLQTKIFHQNTDKITNNYASDIIGRVYQEKNTSSQNFNSQNQENENETNNSFGNSSSLELQYDLEPVEFTRLAKGGREYGYIVEAFVYCGGRIFYANERSFLKVEFGQGEV